MKMKGEAMNKYIIFYNMGKGSTSLVRYANTKEEAMNKLCKQFGWTMGIWLGPNEWSDGTFVKGTKHGDRGYEFRIHEVTNA